MQQGCLRALVCRMLAVPFALVMSYVILCGTSLIVGANACRYFYPVIALLLPYMAYTIFVGFSVLCGKEGTLCAFFKKRSVANGAVSICVIVLILIPLFLGYSRKNVLFLYEEDAEKLAFSREYSKYPLVMVYGSDNSYRSWYVDNQLWPFEQILYVLYDKKDLINDEKLRNADKIVVYMDAPEDFLEQLIEDNSNLSTYTLVRHDLFHYVYLLE